MSRRYLRKRTRMSPAFEAGERAGEQDARAGLKSEYAWRVAEVCIGDARAFGLGYKQGWTRVKAQA